MAASFWVTGADGREYGPVALDTLTRWINEGRLVATTPVRTETSGWLEARQVPELAGHFAPGGPAAPSPGPPGPAGPSFTGTAQPGYTQPAPAYPGAYGGADEFPVWGFIEQAWNLVKVHWLPLAGMVFIMIAIGCVPYIGACVQFIIGGAIAVGIWRAILGMIDGRAPEVGMMFSGFDQFGDAFLAYLVRTILVALGYILLIVPGVILSLMWAFTFPVLPETRLSFWEAMRRSSVLTEGYRWQLFLLALACFLVLLVGLVALCVGVFVAFPVCLTAFGLAYRWLQARKGMRHVMAPPAGPAAPAAPATPTAAPGVTA